MSTRLANRQGRVSSLLDSAAAKPLVLQRDRKLARNLLSRVRMLLEPLNEVSLGPAPGESERLRLRRERDLYLRLLELGVEEELEPFLEEALTLVVEVTGARRAYLELRGQDDEAPIGWMARDCSSRDIQGIHAAISRGIIAEALATGDVVTTRSALLDPRFQGRSSVQGQRIEAVACAPIGREPCVGVLYLQGHPGSGPFPSEANEQLEIFTCHVAPLAERLLQRWRRRERGDPTRRLREQLRLENVAGRSAALASVLRQVGLVAPLDVHVLLTGGSGTGKSQLARAIHDNGPRAGEPFVEVNCAALPESLIENELFGSHAGAHSTAHRSLPGKVAAAERGTLFLDEVGELTLSAQAKVLQLLQSKLYYPLGAAEPARADVRVIAATNSDLEQAVRERRFREDLLYRLQVLPIRLPSLSERREDIPELARHFCAQASERHGLRQLEISPGALRAIEAADWPGNVRQLAHAIEAAVIRAAGEGVQRLEQNHVFPQMERTMQRGDQHETFQEATRRFQSSLLERTLDETEWNVTEAARRLDLARSHVYNLIHAFGFQRGTTAPTPDA